MQDFTGVPAVVDLAAMRQAMLELGGDPQRINPLSPVDLVIDHSVQVDAFGKPGAFSDQCRARVRAQLTSATRSCAGARPRSTISASCRPAPASATRSTWSIWRQVVWTAPEGNRQLAFPDTLVGTDSHTTMINGLGVLGWGVGGIEAEAAMLGQPISMVIPEVVGFKLTGQLPEGATATDLVLTVTQMLRKKGVVGKFVEYLRRRPRPSAARRSRDASATCRPSTARPAASSRSTGRRSITCSLTGRTPGADRAGRGLRQGAGHVARRAAPPTRCSPTPSSSISRTVEPSLAGPKRPQDRVALSSAKAAFEEALPSMLGQGRQARRARADRRHGATSSPTATW